MKWIGEDISRFSFNSAIMGPSNIFFPKVEG